MYYIDCANTIDNTVLNAKHEFIPHEMEPGHGFRLPTIKLICKQQKGFVRYYEDNHYVHVVAVLPLPIEELS